MTTIAAPCVPGLSHFWRIDSSTASGGLAPGYCDHCGQERTFKTFPQDMYDMNVWRGIRTRPSREDEE